MTTLRIGICSVALLLFHPTSAQENLSGHFITEDNSSIVSIEPCTDNTFEFCGYLIGFHANNDREMDRAFCGFRLLGGLTRDNGKLKRGWLLDLESDAAYKLTIHPTKDTSAIKLVIYKTSKLLNETLRWTRYPPTPAATVTHTLPPLCVSKPPHQQ